MVKSLLVFILFAAVTLPCGDVSAANGRALSQRGGIDINGDGKAELLVRSADARILAGRLQDGVFQFSPVADPGVNERIVGVLDLNGNGKSDIVFQRLTQGEFGEVRGWHDFDFLFGGVFLRNVKRVWDVQAVGDLDGDGFADLVWRYVVSDTPDTGVSYIWFTNGVAVTQVRKRGAAPLSWQLLGAADINHDGADDLIYVSPDGSIRALMATPARTCANLSAGALPTGFIALAMADMTGFGRGDILIRNITTGENSLISLNATGVVLPTATANPDDPNASCTASASLVMTTLHTLPATDIGWQFYAADDYNGDGIADVVGKKPDGSLAVWLMTRIAAASPLALGLAPIAKVHGVLTPVILANAGTAPAGFAALNSVTPPNTHALSVAKFGTGAGNVASSPAGISCGAACAAAFRQGSSVSLTATPTAGSRFAGWFNSCSGTGGCSVTMSGEKLVSAAFVISLLPQQLTVAVTGTGSGSVSSAPPSINCTYVTSAAGSTVGQPCSAFLPDGTNVTLAASAAADSTFVGWSGPCSGTGTCTVVMDSAKTHTAVFNKTAGYKVVVGILRGVLGGDGTVTSSPAGINCGGSCSATYASGTTVVLTATPATGSRFTGWGGACGGTGVCTLFVNSTFIDPSIPTPMPNVTASFERTTVTMLSVTTAGTGGGTVTSSPTASYCVSIPGQSQICSIGIICGSSCRASYPVGTVVTLSAIPNNNSIFVGWVGACSGTVSCVLTMNTDQTVGATFDLPPQLLRCMQ